MKRKRIDPGHMLPVQPVFIIGTWNEDGTPNFAPITWVSKTYVNTHKYILIISMLGAKRTKQNVLRTKQFSVNLASTDMLGLVDYFGHVSGNVAPKTAIPYTVDRAECVDAPTLDMSRWVCECEIIRNVTIDDSDTFFCAVKNVQLDERIDAPPFTGPSPGLDLTKLEPIIYSGDYHTVGQHLGKIGDFYRP